MILSLAGFVGWDLVDLPCENSSPWFGAARSCRTQWWVARQTKQKIPLRTTELFSSDAIMPAAFFCLSSVVMHRAAGRLLALERDRMETQRRAGHKASRIVLDNYGEQI
jgi:hypothetical protein